MRRGWPCQLWRARCSIFRTARQLLNGHYLKSIISSYNQIHYVKNNNKYSNTPNSSLPDCLSRYIAADRPSGAQTSSFAHIHCICLVKIPYDGVLRLFQLHVPSSQIRGLKWAVVGSVYTTKTGKYNQSGLFFPGQPVIKLLSARHWLCTIQQRSQRWADL